MGMPLKGIGRSKFIGKLESAMGSINIKMLLKISVLVSIVLLFSGSLLFTTDITISQEFGYAAFIALLTSSVLLLIGIAEKRKENAEDTTDTKVDLNDSSAINFILVNALASSMLIFISLRLVIFGDSLTGILNPVFNNLWMYPFNLISGYAGNGQGFIVQNFYLNLLSLIPLPLLLYQKIVVVFEFYFYYFLAAAVSTVLYRAINIKSIGRSLFSVLFSYLFLANLIFRSEGFSSFIIGPIMIAYVLAKIFESVKYDHFRTDDAILIGFAVSFAIFGDPRVMVYFFIIVLGTILSAPLYHKFTSLTKFFAKTYAVMLPLFGIMFYMTSFVAVFQPNGGRVGDLSTIAFFSSSTAPMFIFNFMANWWSNFVVAPPTVILTGLKTLNFMPTIYAGNAIAIVPGGPLTVLWSISLSVVSLFTIASIYLIFRSNNRSLGIIILPFLVMFILTLGTNIKFMPVVKFSAFLSTLPVVGPLWAVTVSTPQFIDQYLSSFLIILALFSVLTLSQIIEKNLPKSIKPVKFLRMRLNLRRNFKYFPLALILFMFLLANWQFIDQSYAIGPQLPGELPGNQVGHDTYLTPVNPPQGWLSSYQSLYPSENFSYSVYSNNAYNDLLNWYSSFNIGSSPGISPNTEFNTLLTAIVSQNQTWLLPSLMQDFGVKYIFFDKSQVHPDWQLLSFLNYTALYIYKSTPSVTVFALNSSSAVLGYQNTYSVDGMNSGQILNLSYLLSGSGQDMLLSPENVSGVTFGNYNSNSSDKYFPINTVANMFPSSTLPDLKGNLSGSSGADVFNIGKYLTVIRYNGMYNVSYSLNGGVLSIHKVPVFQNYNKSNPPLFFVGYNNLNNTGGGTIHVPSGDSVILNYSFSYTSNSTGDLGFYSGPNVVLSSSLSFKKMSGDMLMPPGTSDFSVGFSFASYNGTFTVKDINISYTFVKDSLVKLQTLHSGNITSSDYGIVKYKGYPYTNYTISYVASNNKTHSVYTETVYSSSSGLVNFTLSGFKYIGNFAIFKTSSAQHHLEVIYPRYNNGGSKLEFSSGDYGYIEVSYSEQYRWETSHNMKFLGVNLFGQQVYELNGPGNYTLQISGAQIHMVTDWATAIGINIGVPLWLVTSRIYKRASRRNSATNSSKAL